jgi:glyoxylate/hydroxypyruvate reductase A
MTLLVVVPDRNNDKLIAKLQALLPEVNIVEWQAGLDCTDVEFVLAWNPPESIWASLPNLKVIASYGAGVDALIKQRNLPKVPVTRIVDPHLAQSMSEYVLHAIGFFKLRFNQYLFNKPAQYWKPRRAHSGNKVGILGMGELGFAVAQRLTINGFKVSGWSRSQKMFENIATYSGPQGLEQMLESLDYLVCLLPLTPNTEGILDEKLFNRLPKGAVLINVARGDHLNEADLIAALNSEQLSGAALDVFATEPLEKQHPFWHQPNILLTPHVSAVTNVDTACRQIADNYLRFRGGTELNHTIDRGQGY